jgi:hypothetical protein
MNAIKLLGAVVLAGIGYASYRYAQRRIANALIDALDPTINTLSSTNTQETSMQSETTATAIAENFSNLFQGQFDVLWNARADNGMALAYDPRWEADPALAVTTSPLAEGVYGWVEGADGERFLVVGGGDMNLIVFDLNKGDGAEYLWPNTIEGIESDAYMLMLLQGLNEQFDELELQYANQA